MEENIGRHGGHGPRWKRVGWLAGMAVSFMVAWVIAGVIAAWLQLPPLWGVATTQLAILLVFLIFALADGDGMRGLGLTSGWQAYDVGIIAAVVVTHYTGSFVSANLFLRMGLIDPEGSAAGQLLKAFGDYDVGTFLMMALLLALMAGVFEELLFRGYLITRLEKLGLGAWGCILLSAAIFGLVHWPGYGFWMSLSKAIWFGIPTGAAFWYRRNLGPLIVAHTVVDFLGFSLAFALAKLVPSLPAL